MLEKLTTRLIIEQIKDEIVMSAVSEGISDREQARVMIAELADRVMARHDDVEITQTDRSLIIERVVNDNLNYGVLQPLIEDNTITEIMAVPGGFDIDRGYLPPSVYVERSGKLEICQSVEFESAAELKKIIDKIVEDAGTRCDETHPSGCAMLMGGIARATYAIPPVALDGPSLTLRKFAEDMMCVGDLVGFDALTPSMAMFLRSAVASQTPIIISGGTGSGKTTLLNALSEFISDDERIITIEDTPELRLHASHVERRQTTTANTEGSGVTTIRDLIALALRSRPDRIMVGECRGAEAYDMLQAMQTDHPGSMTTIHANDPDNAFVRLATLVGYSPEVPADSIMMQISESLKGGLIVHTDRLADGARRIVAIVEVGELAQGANVIPRETLFEWIQTGVETTPSGSKKVTGHWHACGFQPQLLKARITNAGQPYNPQWFFDDQVGASC